MSQLQENDYTMNYKLRSIKFYLVISVIILVTILLVSEHITADIYQNILEVYGLGYIAGNVGTKFANRS